NARIAGLQQALSAARSQQVQETTRRTQERVEALEDPGDAVRTLASENAALADRMTGILSRIDGLAETESVLENDLQRVTRVLESVEQQLAVAGAVGSTELGMELLAQRRQLARDRRMAVQLSALDEEVTRARLESIRLGELRLSPAERAGADTPLMQDLQAERARLLRMASTNYDRYVEMLTRVRSAASRLMERTDELQRLLDSHLFWTPTTPPVSVGTLAVVGEEMAWLTAPARWADVTAAVRSSWTRVLLGGLVVVTLVGLLVGSRERMRQVLEHQAAKLGSFVQDRARYTWIALVISLALALPVPLMLAGGALVLEDGGGFSAVLASGLWTGAALLFVIEVLRHICHPEGLGRRHFGWSEYACSVLRRNLPWLAVVLVPTAMVASLVDPRSDGPLTSALSRITLAVASVAVAAFAYRVLRPGRGVLHSWESDTASGWRKANRYLLHPASVLAPLLLLGLSWAGYHYSALELESRLFASVGIVVLAVLLYDLIVRGVAVTERRLTARQTLAKRRKAWAQLSTRRAAGDAAEGVPDQLQQLEQAPEDVDAQARALVRMAVVVAAVAILWTAWSDVLPALDVLNDMVLWTVGEEGGDDLRITLGSLLAAAALAFLTYFAARNVPGSLEVAVFSRMHLQPGTGYAIKTVITYLIVLVGSIAVLNFVGAQWSKLQWLVAALGVGLGFGLQEIVANFVSGLVILFERPIRVGDTVTVGEITGTVTRIRIRATTITDWDRKEQIIPNKTFITSQLTNWTLTDPITRVVIHVRVAYGSDVGATHQALTEVIEENPRVVADPPPAVFFVGFGDSSLDFELRVFIENMLDMMPLIHELHSSIVEKLEENGIRIPYPQRDIRIRRDDPAVE
ncbi:MAG: mechanosensitive ion channel domain-containing protein, partial [Pseudomonadota bacterium]